MKVFEPALLPESVKEQLCRDLLEEFGAVSIRHRAVHHELTHGCLVNPELHTNQLHDPTASLNYEKLTYKCLGCHAQGGLIWLIVQIRKCAWDEARAWLNDTAGTGEQVMPLSRLLEFYDALYQGPSRPPPIPVYAPSTLEPWLQPCGPYRVHPWLTEGVPDMDIKPRHIPEQNAIDLKLGWDRQDDTIVIPHFWEGKLVGWQKRRLSGDGPKYESTEGIPRERTIYDYDPKRRQAIIVESPMSVARHRHVLPMEATLGSNVTDRQIKLIAAHYERCMLWMDNDEAGWKALEGTENSPGMIERLSPYCPVWIIDSPFAGDPADLPTVVAEMIVQTCAKPAHLWQRPRYLSCTSCGFSVHEGPCQAEDDQEEDHGIA